MKALEQNISLATLTGVPSCSRIQLISVYSVSSVS
jgi:hypothetical protein